MQPDAQGYMGLGQREKATPLDKRCRPQQLRFDPLAIAQLQPCCLPLL
jgi:hypothetical protein